MNPDVLKIISVTAGAIVSAPLVAAAMRAFFFFGEMSRTVHTMESEFKAGAEALGTWKNRIEDLLAKHDNRITRIEAERQTEREYGRRHDDVSRPHDRE